MGQDNINNYNVANTDAEEDTPKHPYHLQLAEFQPNAWQLEERQPQKYLPLAETKLTMVDSQELLDEMMTKLKQVIEFAIDLEDHTYRSFVGFVCLVQISTRTEDFIVDAIKLKEEITVLNEVCTDPNILKVFHRSHDDILRLQRDFSIYIVNMFDTSLAARILNHKDSLPRTVKDLCDIEVNKKYKLSDWRVRPLPPDMMNHARQGTHYLLYICDVYTNKSLGKVEALKRIYEKSTKLCGLVYEPPEYNADSYKSGYKKIEKWTLTSQQLKCLRLLHEWRYNIACEQDESTGYILPNKMLFQIIQKLPTNDEDITACCNKILPPLVQQNITHVLALVKKAIDVPEVTVGSELAGDKIAARDNNAAGKKSKKLFCFKCKKTGHMTKTCGKLEMSSTILDNSKNRPFCFKCDKAGHFPKYCKNGEMADGAFVGRYGHPRRDFHRGGYGGGYGIRGFHPTSQPGYEGLHPDHGHFPRYPTNAQPFFQGYGPVRPRFDYYPNPWHPYP